MRFPDSASRGRWLLGLGAVLGLGIAVADAIVAPSPQRAGLEAVAWVGDVPITKARYARAEAATLEGKRDIRPEDRARVLERLVDEELLLQRGVALGLVTRDGAVRKAVVASVLESIRVESAAQTPPDEAALRRFFDAHPDHFRVPAQVRATRLFVAARTPQAHAAVEGRVGAALQGGMSFEAAQAAFGNAVLSPLPEGLLPARALLNYLGGPLADMALRLPVGEVSLPVRAPEGVSWVKVLERVGGALPTFEAVRQQVADAVDRERDEAHLRAVLARLRRQTPVTFAP